MDPFGQSLLGSEPVEQREELPALGGLEAATELLLVLNGDLHDPAEQPPALVGDQQIDERLRRVAVALLVDGVPIDVLADRLGTTRGALYKTLHDARTRLRADLTSRGYLPDAVSPRDDTVPRTPAGTP